MRLFAFFLLFSASVASAQTFWTSTATPPITRVSSTTDIAISQVSGTLFVGTAAKGVSRSDDRGAQWQQVTADTAIFCIKARIDGLVIAGGADCVYITTNDGTTWTRKPIASAWPVRDIVFDSDGGIYITTAAVEDVGRIGYYRGDGVFYSADDGQTWQQRNTGITGSLAAWNIAITSQDELVVAMNDDASGVAIGGIYFSVNKGLNWTKINLKTDDGQFLYQNIAVRRVHDLMVDKHDTVYLTLEAVYTNFLVQFNGRLAMSDVKQSGVWEIFSIADSVVNPVLQPILDLMFCQNDGTLWGSAMLPGVYKSDDSAQTWEGKISGITPMFYSGPFPRFFVCHMAEHTDGTLFLVQEGDTSVYKADSTRLGSPAPCDSFCVTNIQLDTTNNSLDITIFLEGDSNRFINYPYVTAVTDSSGDTLATGFMNFYGQFGGTSQTYGTNTTLNSLPASVTATIHFHYDNNSVCALPYPCPDTCSFTPTVSGDVMLCPDEQGTLSTQIYDSYQWFKREFFGTAQPVAGATSQTLAIDQFNDAGYYFSVEVTDSNCTERSAEVLVDSWVFLLPVVETTGDFTTGINGETIICEGDTAYYTLLQPYETNITWYKDGSPLAGATGNTLAVTDSGNYSVEGAPAVCPNFIQQLGATLEVQVVNCTTGVNTPREIYLNCYWNNSENAICIKNIPAGAGSLEAAVYSAEGKLLKQEIISSENGFARTTPTALLPGTYICSLRYGNTVIAKKLVVME